MKIGIVQRDDTRDVRASSGTLYFMAKALEEHVGEVVHLGPDTSLLGKMLVLTAKVLNKASYVVFKRRISTIHHRLLAWESARFFEPRIAESQCDVLFAPFASVEIAALSTTVPIVYHTDMTWVDAVGYYTVFSSLFEFAQKEGEGIQKAAFDKAAASFFPSAWTARNVARHYRVDARNIHVVPYGANFEAADVPSAERALAHDLDGGVSLLWIGVSWERKGGSIVYDCLMALLEKGVDARLTVCGCVPPDEYRHAKMTVIPFLDKRDSEQRKGLSELFLAANFFLFPTTTEALGIVICEASAHGLPSLVRDTGGVGGAAFEGENGFLLDKDAVGADYAEKIVEIVANPAAYRQMVVRSRELYEERLNWDAWGRSVRKIFEDAVASGRSR